MKKKGFKWVLRVAFAVVFFVSTALLAGKLQDGFSGSSDYEQALEIARGGQTLPVTETVPAETAAAVPVPTETQQPEERWVPAPLEEDDPHLPELEAIDLDALRKNTAFITL
mgnify:CR=1 FL=1